MAEAVSYPNSKTLFNTAVDNFYTVLSVGIDDSELTISLPAGNATLPNEGVITVESEQIYYESKTPGIGDACTLTASATGRGFEGTTPVAHGAGVTVARLVVASDINHLEQVVERLQDMVGYYKSASLTPSAMMSPAQVDALFVIDEERRTMVIDFDMIRTFSDATKSIFASGTLRCIRYTEDADNPEEGDLDIQIFATQDGSSTSIGVDFSMSGDGADSTALMYQTSDISNTDSITFRGTVRFTSD